MPAAFECASHVSGFEWLTPFNFVELKVNFVEGCAVLLRRNELRLYNVAAGCKL